MTSPLGVNEFFVLEAGEYLDRLAGLIAGPATPPPDDLLRSARALRGSALMASQSAIARAAGGLESLIRAVRENRRPWDTTLAAAAAEGVAEIRTYLTRLPHWSETDSAAAEALATRLEAAVGGAGRPSVGVAVQADAGSRAFVAREGAAVASVLDQASRILRAGPGAREALQAALSRTQPLRGLAALADYPPLAEILDAVELTATNVERGELEPQSAAGVLDASARAMSRAARDVIEKGRPDLEAAETRQLGELLATVRGNLPVIVPIDELFPEDGEPGVVQAGTATPPGRAELVSRGERLRQVADDLERAGSAAQRALRLHMVSHDLRAIAVGIAGNLGHRLHHFGRQSLEAITKGETGRLALHLRRAGELLQGYDEAPDTSHRLIERLMDLTLAVLAPAPSTGQMRAIVIPPPAPAAAPVVAEEPELELIAPPHDPDLDLPIVPIESLLYDEVPTAAAVEELPIVPIEQLAPEPAEFEPELLTPVIPVAPPPPRPVPAAAPVARTAEEAADLAGSFVTYHRLIAELGMGAASLEALLRGSAAPAPAVTAPAAPKAPTPVPPPIAPAPAAAVVRPPEPVAAAPRPAPAAVEAEIVEIATLCYRGRGALERAAIVREQIKVARTARAAPAVVDPLVEELLDLVELALVDAA